MKVYYDGNTILHDGEEITDSSEKEMRRSMLNTIHLLIGICYMKGLYFEQA